MYPNRRACICFALALCTIGVTAAQENQWRTTPLAAGQTTFGLGAGGRPTTRRLAASQAATRAVALCSGLRSGGQGQYAMIIPSHKTVIVRRGFDAGAGFKIEKFCANVLAAID